MFEVIIAGIIILIVLKIIFGITKVALKILLFLVVIGLVLYIINFFFPLIFLL
jgi:hypothetical protein